MDVVLVGFLVFFLADLFVVDFDVFPRAFFSEDTLSELSVHVVPFAGF